jgi:restriction endonuclease
LHDKELLLSLDNPRRFIFSKWTLREGWDSPNVFQICKLRSSGSTTSKLQEVGRGLRLPVNEYMGRVKDRTFNYLTKEVVLYRAKSHLFLSQFYHLYHYYLSLKILET